MTPAQNFHINFISRKEREDAKKFCTRPPAAGQPVVDRQG